MGEEFLLANLPITVFIHLVECTESLVFNFLGAWSDRPLDFTASEADLVEHFFNFRKVPGTVVVFVNGSENSVNEPSDFILISALH
jgi:hypothetical protein